MSVDPAVQRCLLAIFWERPFPLGHEPLLPLLTSDRQPVVFAASIALGQFCHPQVRARGLELFGVRETLGVGLHLLLDNLEPGDYLMLAERVAAEQDDDALHDLGWFVRDSFARHPWPEAAEVLRLLYERGPCAMCRGSVVADLLALDALPAELAEECRFDASMEVRHLVGFDRQSQ